MSVHSAVIYRHPASCGDSPITDVPVLSQLPLCMSCALSKLTHNDYKINGGNKMAEWLCLLPRARKPTPAYAVRLEANEASGASLK